MSDIDLLAVPLPSDPTDWRAEEQLLIQALAYPDDTMHVVMADLKPEHFGCAFRGALWGLLCKRWRAGQSLELHEVIADVIRLGERRFGGAQRVADLGFGAFSCLNLAPLVERVRAKYQRARAREVLIGALQALDGQTTDAPMSGATIEAKGPPQVMEQTRMALDGLLSESTGSTRATLGTAAQSARERRKEASRSGQRLRIPTGLRDLDQRLLGGLALRRLHMLAAMASDGKSALALGMARTAALAGFPVLVLSLEDEEEALADRYVAQRAEIDLSRILTDTMTPEQDAADARCRAELAALRELEIWHQEEADLSALHAEAVRWRATTDEEEPALLIVDHMNEISVPPDKGRTDLFYGEVAKGFKTLSKRLNCAVLLLCQMNAEIERYQANKGKDRTPRKSDLKEGLAAYEKTDCMLFLRRDGGSALIHIDKQRNGPSGVACAQYVSSLTLFRDYPTASPDDEEEEEERRGFRVVEGGQP